MGQLSVELYLDGHRPGRHDDSVRDLDHHSYGDAEADHQRHASVIAGRRPKLHDHLEHDGYHFADACLHGLRYRLHRQRIAGGERLARADGAVGMGGLSVVLHLDRQRRGRYVDLYGNDDDRCRDQQLGHLYSYRWTGEPGGADGFDRGCHQPYAV